MVRIAQGVLRTAMSSSGSQSRMSGGSKKPFLWRRSGQRKSWAMLRLALEASRESAQAAQLKTATAPLLLFRFIAARDSQQRLLRQRLSARWPAPRLPGPHELASPIQAAYPNPASAGSANSRIAPASISTNRVPMVLAKLRSCETRTQVASCASSSPRAALGRGCPRGSWARPRDRGSVPRAGARADPAGPFGPATACRSACGACLRRGPRWPGGWWRARR